MNPTQQPPAAPTVTPKFSWAKTYMDYLCPAMILALNARTERLPDTMHRTADMDYGEGDMHFMHPLHTDSDAPVPTYGGQTGHAWIAMNREGRIIMTAPTTVTDKEKWMECPFFLLLAIATFDKEDISLAGVVIRKHKYNVTTPTIRCTVTRSAHLAHHKQLIPELFEKEDWLDTVVDMMCEAWSGAKMADVGADSMSSIRALRATKLVQLFAMVKWIVDNLHSAASAESLKIAAACQENMESVLATLTNFYTLPKDTSDA